MRILICGGGTAGHIYPGLALARELKQLTGSAEILFLGTPDGLEASIVPQAGFSFKAVKVKGFKRRISSEFVVFLATLLVALIRSLKIVRDFRPGVVVGLGGYVSIPGLLAALLMRIPTIIHEQNAVPGLANRTLAKYVDVVAFSYPGSEVYFPFKEKTIITGNPVRKEASAVSREAGISILKLDNSKKTLLVFGGSRGAKRINEAAMNAYALFRNRDDLQILHITGKLHYKNIVSAVELLIKEEDKLTYRIYPYVDNMGAFYGAADLVLCRAGATTIAELVANGIAAILVPYPFATEAHQEKNAQFVEERGAAAVVLDSDLTPDLLYQEVNRIIKDKERLKRMTEAAKSLGSPQAGRTLAETVLEVSRKSTKVEKN